MGGLGAKQRRVVSRAAQPQHSAAAETAAVLISAAARGQDPGTKWIDCGYCQTRHIAFCGFTADYDSDAMQGHPNGDRKWVTCLQCGVPHAKRCDWDGADESTDSDEEVVCVICASAVDDEALECTECGEAVCNDCLGYIDPQATDCVLCGGCVGTCLVCDRSWSMEVDGCGDGESWIADGSVPNGDGDDELLTCPSCYLGQ